MITADQARALTESKTFEYHMNQASNFIKQRAKAGYNSWAMTDTPAKVIEQVKKRLQGRGFTVKYSEKNNETIIINW